MSPAELAAHIDLPRAVLDDLLAERTRMTPDLAKRLGVALGQGAHYWLALQLQFDLWQAAQTDLDGVRPVTWGRGVGRARSLTSAHPAAGRPLFGT
jgi:addiction module HigA family antidote